MREHVAFTFVTHVAMGMFPKTGGDGRTILSGCRRHDDESFHTGMEEVSALKEHYKLSMHLTAFRTAFMHAMHFQWLSNCDILTENNSDWHSTYTYWTV